MLDKNFLGNEGFYWGIGVVEDRQDPLTLGRVRVRVYGVHSASLTDIPSTDLPWATVMQPTTASAPLVLKEADIVVLFFADGPNKQIPIVVGILPGFQTVPNNQGQGFNDLRSQSTRQTSPVNPTTWTYNYDGSGIKVNSPSVAPPYPLSTQLNIPTLSGATRFDVANNVIGTKQNNLDKGIVTATGLTWDEPYPAYNPLYPYNSAFQTESGHIVEYDDTPGNERIAVTHRTGSYDEYRATGSHVQKITKSNYQIVMGDNYVHIMGRILVTVGEGVYIKALGDVNLEADNNLNVKVAGDADISVGGALNFKSQSLNFDVAKDATTVSGSIHQTSSGEVDIVGNSIKQTSSGDVDIKGGSVNLEGSINLNGSTAISGSISLDGLTRADYITNGPSGASGAASAASGSASGIPAAPSKATPNSGVAGPEPTPIPFQQNIQSLDAHTATALKQSMYNSTSNGVTTTADANAANIACNFDPNTHTFLSSSNWTISAQGLATLQTREGLAKILANGSIMAYPDPNPVLGASLMAIGYGTTNAVLPTVDFINANTIITKAQAQSYLENAINNIFLPKIQEYVSVNLTQSMVDSLISLIYNIGVNNFANSSVLRFTNLQQWCSAANAFLFWNRSGVNVLAGLTDRRSAEKTQYLS